MSAVDRPLSRLRRRIDDLDAQLVDLLSERARIVLEIGEHKRRVGAPVHAPARERRVLSRATTRAAGVLPACDVQAVVREVIHGARRLQGIHTVAVLGPVGSHSDVAAREHFGERATIVACEAFADVVDAVVLGKVDAAMVPVHNSTTGPLPYARDAVAANLERLRLRESFRARIEHCLVGRGPISAIATVVSHPEALRQCGAWLDAHLPSAVRVTTTSSSAAVRQVVEAPDTIAAIGSARAAAIFGAPVIASGLTEASFTQFWVLVPT